MDINDFWLACSEHRQVVHSQYGVGEIPLMNSAWFKDEINGYEGLVRFSGGVLHTVPVSDLTLAVKT